MKKDTTDKKITLQMALDYGIKAGLNWYAKLRMRCMIDGCVYGIKGVDKTPQKVCIYCGEENLSYHIKNMPKSIRKVFETLDL